MELSDKKIVLVERNEKVVYQDGNRIVKAFKPSKAASDVFNEAVNLARVAEAGVRVPKVLEVSQTADGGWALSTEYVPGTTLRKKMDEAKSDAEMRALIEAVSGTVKADEQVGAWSLTAHIPAAEDTPA